MLGIDEAQVPAPSESGESDPPSAKRVKLDSVSPNGEPLSSHVSDGPSSKRLKAPRRPGVVYISRLPPYLKPRSLRQLFAVHGPISNLFLTPESPAQYHNRVRVHNGNKKRQYTDGWVEFEKKKHAKSCVDAINGRTTAEGFGHHGSKGKWYRDDVWSVKYLRGFSWEDLMQSTRIEDREREERIRFGIRKEIKEHDAFLAGIQNSKIEETRKKKRPRKSDIAEPEDNKHAAPGQRAPNWTYHQHEPNEKKETMDSTERVLSKIF